jgi:TrmH family RNA methyltransferase
VTEGIRVVEDLVDSELDTIRVVAASSLEDTERGRRLVERARVRGIDVRIVADHEVDRLSATESPQGVIAIAAIPNFSLEKLGGAKPPTVVVLLDGVQDPGNFGTLIRSAEALGASGVVALPGTVDPWNPKSVRAAAGSSFRIPIGHATWDEAAAHFRGSGFVLWGAAGEGEPVPDAPPERVALVLGNEGAGLSREVREGVDRLVGIPTRGRAESLNVAAAGAILLYEMLR